MWLMHYPGQDPLARFEGSARGGQVWNARGKKFSIVPEFKVGEFAVVWRGWWESLQPKWRPQDTWPPSQDTPPDEDWGILQRGGINGLFVIIMCISWWATKKMSSKEWSAFEAAKSDVAWVIRQVSHSLTRASPAKWPAEDSSGACSRKHPCVSS
jgi:hypothetical protein